MFNNPEKIYALNRLDIMKRRRFPRFYGLDAYDPKADAVEQNNLNLQEGAQNNINRDTSRLANLNHMPYPGKTLSPMSSLTQKAQILDEKRTGNGMPYRNSLSKIANAPIGGISQDNLQSMLENLKAKHSAFNQNVTGNRLSKQFGSKFNQYKDKYNSNADEDANLQMGAFKGDLENLNEHFKKLERQKNSSTFDAISNSSRGKNARQQGLINDLNNYGNQKQIINNKILTGEKARFEAEKNEPYERLQNLQTALNNYNNGDDDHPDIRTQKSMGLKKAMNAYDNPIPTYQGKLVEPINADMNTSYQLAKEISPNYQDANYASRKQIRKGLTNPADGMNQIVNEFPNKINPRFTLLDAEAKKKAKADMTSLNAKYIKRGTYGSQSHIKSASDRMGEINAATLEAKNKMMQNELGENVATHHTNAMNNMTKLDQYDKLANNEFDNILDDIKRTNNVGIEKWKNNQTGNEQLYKSYQSEKGHQQPRLLSNARNVGAGRGIDSMFGYFKNEGVDLNKISDLQGRYNNLEKELATSNDTIKNQNTYSSQQPQIAEQQQRLATEQQQQRLATEMERQQAANKANAKNIEIERGRARGNAINHGSIRDREKKYLDMVDDRIAAHNRPGSNAMHHHIMNKTANEFLKNYPNKYFEQHDYQHGNRVNEPNDIMKLRKTQRDAVLSWYNDYGKKKIYGQPV